MRTSKNTTNSTPVGGYLHWRIYITLVICLAACGAGDKPSGEGTQEVNEQEYKLNAVLEGERPTERRFVDIAFNRTVNLPSSEDAMLFNPAALWYLDDGNIYVWDSGDFRIKAFSVDGEFLGAFGDGRGEGPGQFQVARGLTLQQDSVVLFDPMIRRSSYFARDGALGKTVQHERQFTNVTRSRSGTVYKMNVAPGAPDPAPYVRMERDGQRRQIDNLLDREVSSIVFDGVLHASPNQGIYVPLYYPVLLAFAPRDSIARAYPSPDYGSVPLPEPQTSGEGFSRVTGPPELRVHWGSQVSGKTLAVQIRPQEQGTSLFDIYDVTSLTYQHTARIPSPARGGSLLAYDEGLLISRGDTTVVVHHLALDAQQN